MLQLSEYIANKPVLSLRTGEQVATAISPLINPKNLKVEGFYCDDVMDKKRLIMLDQDIRETTLQGYIIDDYDVLCEPEELVRLKDVIELEFGLLKKPVETVAKDKVGKVHDYAVDMSTMYVQKLYVSKPFWKNLAGGSLGIDRTQIVEVTTKRIVINELLQPTPTTADAVAA